jgi:glycosyltransferase involved in cell wall biosynthesis
LIVHNGQRFIRDVLEALEFCDEFVIVDSFSTDGTWETIMEFAASRSDVKAVQRKWTNFSDQRQYSLDLALSDWVIWADADEIVPKEMRDEIEHHLTNGTAYAGFWVNRLDYFIDRPVTFGGRLTDHRLLVFKRDRGRFDGRAVHEGVVLDGPAGWLDAPLLHYSNPDIDTRLRKLNDYSSLSAADAVLHGGPIGWRELVLHPLRYGFNLVVRQRAFADGWRGYIWAMSLVAEAFFSSAKIWEQQYWLTRSETLRDPPENE